MKNQKILIVDDEKDLRELLADEYEEAGYEVLQASSGNSAWEFIKELEIDLIISDIRMPDGDGIELLNKVKGSEFSYIPVVLVTAFTNNSTLEEHKSKIDYLLHKPFDLSELFAISIGLLSRNKSFTNYRGNEAHP